MSNAIADRLDPDRLIEQACELAGSDDFGEADGTVRLAIGAHDSGHGHWLDTGGRTRGFVTVRWLDNPQAPEVDVQVMDGKAIL